jgi:xanthine dehydrogenase accessory factor
MYDVALSVSACARAGTRADVAWMLAPRASNDVVAFTPGGGRVGVLAGGAFDGLLGDVAARRLARGRRVVHEVTEFESPICGLPAGTTVEFLVIPADQVPVAAWPLLLDHLPVALDAELEADEVVDLTIEEPSGEPSVVAEGDRIRTVFAPIPRLVIAGQGPYAEALAEQGRLLGWRVATEGRPDRVLGLTAGLSWLDSVVVMGHDVESSSRCLMAALESQAGYVGALGSMSMQQARADWLAYQDVTDLSRVHGPAGLDLGARTPAEVAVSIVAQILMVRARGDGGI